MMKKTKKGLLYITIFSYQNQPQTGQLLLKLYLNSKDVIITPNLYKNVLGLTAIFHSTHWTEILHSSTSSQCNSHICSSSVYILNSRVVSISASNSCKVTFICLFQSCHNMCFHSGLRAFFTVKPSPHTHNHWDLNNKLASIIFSFCREC